MLLIDMPGIGVVMQAGVAIQAGVVMPGLVMQALSACVQWTRLAAKAALPKISLKFP
jgi:hypothetical protein